MSAPLVLTSKVFSVLAVLGVLSVQTYIDTGLGRLGRYIRFIRLMLRTGGGLVALENLLGLWRA